MFENETYEAIMARMLAQFPDTMDKREGSVLWDLLSPKAAELAQAYIQMDNVINLGFASTTYGEYLERRALEQGLTRKPATFATGYVTVTAPEGTPIPQGTRFSTDDETPVYFKTLEDAVVGANPLQIEVQSETAGTPGNVNAGDITIVVGDLAGVASVTNDEEFSGGYDEESDEELYNRYYEEVSRPSTSGNKYDYIKWAKSVPGISDAKVYPLWDGPGTVKVVVADSEKRAPAKSILDATVEYIEEQRPVGAEVTVESVVEVPIDINVELTLRDGVSLETAQASVYANIEAYLKSIAFVNDTVRYTGIGNAILDGTGVIDYENLKINGLTSNIILESTEVPVMGALNVTI